VFSMFYGETIVTKTIDYQASFLILNGTAVISKLQSIRNIPHGGYLGIRQNTLDIRGVVMFLS
ncbi:MAG: hypothetical protein ABW087_00870, partial [Candidatus Thiodiazotropha sp.]